MICLISMRSFSELVLFAELRDFTKDFATPRSRLKRCVATGSACFA